MRESQRPGVWSLPGLILSAIALIFLPIAWVLSKLGRSQDDAIFYYD